MIQRTFDVEQINSVLKHPDIWPLIADDEDIETFMPPMDDDTHYLYEPGMLFILHPLDGALEVHANITPDYRDQAMRASVEVLAYTFALNDKIVARIPVEYGRVYGFAKKFLVDEGIVDQVHHLSLERQQWVLSAA